MSCKHRAAFPGFVKTCLWRLMFKRGRSQKSKFDKDSMAQDFVGELARRNRTGAQDNSPLTLLDIEHECRHCGARVRFVSNARNNGMSIAALFVAAALLIRIDPIGELLRWLNVTQGIYSVAFILGQLFIVLPAAWYISIALLYAFGDCEECGRIDGAPAQTDEAGKP